MVRRELHAWETSQSYNPRGKRRLCNQRQEEVNNVADENGGSNLPLLNNTVRLNCKGNIKEGRERGRAMLPGYKIAEVV